VSGVVDESDGCSGVLVAYVTDDSITSPIADWAFSSRLGCFIRASGSKMIAA
jgi:hypothetical protein